MKEIQFNKFADTITVTRKAPNYRYPDFTYTYALPLFIIKPRNMRFPIKMQYETCIQLCSQKRMIEIDSIWENIHALQK
jgi:hypothetical protein